jgi:hypothetical protein
MLTGRNNKLPMQHHICQLRTKSEKLNAICQALNGALQMKRMADKSLLIAACHHIIAVTLVLCIYTLQTKQLVTHKPDEQSRKNKLYRVTTAPYWL